jgi:hypothetical protein
VACWHQELGAKGLRVLGNLLLAESHTMHQFGLHYLSFDFSWESCRDIQGLDSQSLVVPSGTEVLIDVDMSYSVRQSFGIGHQTD